MTVEIPLSRGMVALVDDADAPVVLAYGKWYADRVSSSLYYARKNYWTTIGPERKCKALRMHRVITGWPTVDHVNGDGLDNRRQNLRPAGDRENARNRGLRSDNTSGFKGVYRYGQSGRYVASIYCPGQKRHLGIFASAVEAARAYDAAAVRYFGEFARLNFPLENAA